MSKTYRERRTGIDVVCRFMEYEQDNPQALPDLLLPRELPDVVRRHSVVVNT